MPRMLRRIKTPRTMSFAVKRFAVQVSGRKLKIWSTPEATDVEIVRT